MCVEKYQNKYHQLQYSKKPKHSKWPNAILTRTYDLTVNNLYSMFQILFHLTNIYFVFN